MSRISDRIREFLRLADSSRITDKKKCVVGLLDLYQSDDVLKEICQNTKNKVQGANWPCIMHIAHRLALDEAERRSKETSIRNNERLAICNLIVDTIRRFNETSVEFLKSNDIVSMILQILDSKYYVNYQDTYLRILVTYVLPKSTRHNDITADQWSELLQVCTKLYKKMHITKHVVLDALHMIVECSFSHVNLLADVKNLLLFLEKVFDDVKADEQLTDSFYRLCNSVCRQIATESRVTLCKFSETILMDVLSLNSSEDKYRLLLIFLQIHHPEGTPMYDDRAYACDWNKWKDLLQSMCLLIQENCKLDVQWRSFVQFASEVVKQTIDNANIVSSLNTNYDSPSVKRRRTIGRMENIIDLITESSPEEVWPLIKILTETLRKYPQCLKPQDLATLLQCLTELSQSPSRTTESTEKSIMDNLYKLAAILMENEMSTGEMQDAMIHWSKIWDMLLRSLGANQNEESAHILARCFIKHNKMPNANAFLRLYLTKVIRWSLNSVRTLMHLCNRVSLSEDASSSILEPSPSEMPICDRTRLLEWLLNAPWQKLATRLPVNDICILSVDIILSSRCCQNVRTKLASNLQSDEETRVVAIMSRDIYSTDLPRLCYSSLAFKAQLLASSRNECLEKTPRAMPSGPVSYAHGALSYLKKRLNDIFQEEGTNNDEIYVILMKLALLARILSILKQLGILTETIADCSLIDTLRRYLTNSFEILATINTTRCKYIYLLNVTRALSILYGGTYNADIAGIIISVSTVNMLKNIFDLLNFDDIDAATYQRNNDHGSEEHGIFQENCWRSIVCSETFLRGLPREGAVRLLVVEALALFCAMYTGENKSELQVKMMRNLLKLTMQQDFGSCMDFRISLTILESFTRCNQDETQREYADAPLEFLLKVCQKNRKDEESSRKLLILLPFFFEYATKYHYAPKKIIETLSEFYKRIHRQNCGISLHGDYMKCVCNVIRIDPCFTWSVGATDDISMILNSVVDYIGHPLFVLRIQAVWCLQEFLSFKNIAYNWKEQIFIKVEKIVHELLDTRTTDQQFSSDSQRNCLEEHQYEDEKEIRTATALIALASVACASGVLQGRALRAMLQLTVEREVQTQKVQKVLSAAMQQTTHVSLIEDNLNYLLTYWIDAKYPLQRFPWTLVGCKTADEFFVKHVNYILPLVMRTLGINEAISFCIGAGMEFAYVFEDVFPACFAWLISRDCCDQSDSVSSQTLKKLLKNTDEFALTRNFNQMFHNRLNDVLVELLRRLHDEEHFERMFLLGRISLPEIDMPHFSAVMVAQCFDYLERHFLEKSLTCLLAEQQPATLQRMLLQLMNAVYSTQSSEGKLKRLHQYAYFCSILMRDLAESFFDAMSAFFIRDVCYSLFHLIKSADEMLSAACCEFLNIFLRRVLLVRGAEVRDVLRFIVTNLISLAQIACSTEIALRLLKFLIVEQRDVLCEAIAKLGSFPNLEIFQEVRKTHQAIRYVNGTVCLEDELGRFLDVINDENAECTLEDLANLTQQLSTRKNELKELHRKAERPYLEDGDSVLHQVIFKLIKLTESSNPRVSMEATRCLGELGPTNSMVALRPIGSLVQETNYIIEALTYRSVAMLMNFIVENAIDLRKVSADALYIVLSTTDGQKLSNPKYTKDLSVVLNECAPLKIDYIRPFLHSHDIVKKSFSVNVAKFRIIMNPENALWTVKEGEDYIKWIVKITCGIAECIVDSYLDSFLPVCQLSVEFCELVLPRIVCIIIQRYENFIDTLCDCINQFFRYHFAIDDETETVISQALFTHGKCDRKIVRYMLDIVNHVRTQLPNSVNLKFDYIYLAKAAHECSAYYTALLFAQFACESLSVKYPDFSSDPKIDYIYEHWPQFGRVLQDIMQDTYLNISDPDAICGAGSSYLLDHYSRVQYYARTNSWDKVMLAQDIELSHDNSLAAREMVNALRHSGLQFLQGQFLSNTKDLDEKFGYECAWRLSNWNLLIDDTVASHNELAQSRLELFENAFHQYHYYALKCFHEGDLKRTESAIECARRSVIRCLRIISLESSKIVNEKLSQLRLLREIEQLSSAGTHEYLEVLQRWDQHEILTGQFEYVEPILWQRIIMFRIKESLRMNANLQKAFFSTCLDLAMVAESQGNFPVAARALGTLEKHQNLPEDLQNQLLYQESLLAWMKCDQVIARRLLRSLIEKRNPKPSLRAKALRIYGDWMAETKSENPQTVIQKYYLKSIETSEIVDEQIPDVIRNLHDTQIALARFADAQYEQISAYMKSPIYESLKEYARTPVKMDKAHTMKNKDIKRAVMISQKQSTNDAAELESIEQERRNYLLQALRYYLKTLQCSEEHNLLIFRLVALWLDNMFDEEVNELLNELDTVPSFKFVPLVPQLAAHVSNDLERSFSAKIFNILERCSLEHPYHTLPVVLALKNLRGDDEYDSVIVTKKEERRVLGARRLFKRLTESSVRTIVHEMEHLSRALLSLAYWQPKGIFYLGRRYQIPCDQPICKIKNLSNILLPTLSLPVKPSGNYNDVIGVKTYQETCEFVGGVTAPKKVICVGTDGIHRRQLVKGKDDLRQDAVMQQVFSVINTLLTTCKETKRRNLRIRTYKVVPLTQRSGVLEWCDNTVPISKALVGSASSPGLHNKYYPQDMTAEAARNKMKVCAQESNEMKLKIFLECCKRMRPAFQHFFEEKYLSPEIWVERTLTYTRSIATTSIAGYILGLGDRHLSNILIDEQTAEVVHIDFGVAFEQGKVLPVPETVPFRLTRDLEVAMGASGIEGTMRRSCEVTMTMLRDQRQIIITLLQVLLYDPLFTWTITPEKACKMQSDVVKSFSESSRVPVETNKIAKRALLRIEQKLLGTEDGLVSSVSGQVEKLLQEARDPANLCRIYCGWQPYL